MKRTFLSFGLVIITLLSACSNSNYSKSQFTESDLVGSWTGTVDGNTIEFTFENYAYSFGFNEADACSITDPNGNVDLSCCTYKFANNINHLSISSACLPQSTRVFGFAFLDRDTIKIREGRGEFPENLDGDTFILQRVKLSVSDMPSSQSAGIEESIKTPEPIIVESTEEPKESVTQEPKRYEILFSETFDGDLNNWSIFGSPIPFIDSSDGNSSHSLQLNGDGMYANGGLSKIGFTIVPDMIISFDIQISNYQSGHHWSGLGLSKSWIAEEDYQDLYLLASVGADTQSMVIGDCASTPLSDTNFHNVSFVFNQDLRATVYIDHSTVPYCTTSISYNLTNVPLLVLGREGHIDNILVQVLR